MSSVEAITALAAFNLDVASFVQPTLNSLKWLCYFVLAFYVYQVAKILFKGKPPEESHRLREAMALGYTAVSAYFIFYSTPAIQMFANSVLDTGSSVGTPGPINIFLVLCAGLICFAFICNFCRSLWMLKLLDHAIFEPVPEWAALLNSTPKRLVEFLPRAVAAILFICLESKLERLGRAGPDENLSLLAGGARPPHYLTDAGQFGLYLYGSLIIWWLGSRWFVKAKMPLLLLSFHVIGFVNCSFIYFYGGEPVGPSLAWLMVIVVGIMALAAAYMIFIIVVDVVKTLWSGSTRSKLESKDGNNLAHA